MPVPLVLVVPVPVVLMALMLGMAALALTLFGRWLGTLHVVTIASMLGIATFLAAAAQQTVEQVH